MEIKKEIKNSPSEKDTQLGKKTVDLVDKTLDLFTSIAESIKAVPDVDKAKVIQTIVRTVGGLIAIRMCCVTAMYLGRDKHTEKEEFSLSV